MGRSATLWHKTVDRYGRSVWYITSDEVGVIATGLCSIYDPLSDENSYRLVNGGRVDLDPECDDPYPRKGLIVFGRSKFNRLSLVEARELIGLGLAAAVDAIEAELDT